MIEAAPTPLMIAAREQLWERADLRDMLHRGQLQALALLSAHLFVVLCIARRWGKTWLACVWLVMVAMRTPGARCLYAAPTSKMVRSFAWPHLRKIAEWAPADMRPVIIGDEMRFPNGSLIVAFGCEDTRKADRGRGTEAHAAVIDEAGFIDCLDYVIESVVLPQLLKTDGPMLVVSTPPTTPEHPFSAMAERAQRSGGWMTQPLTIETAPHFTQGQLDRYIDEVGGVGSTQYRREILAELVVDPLRAIVPEFMEHKAAIVSDAPSGPHVDRYTIGDLGYVDLSVIALVEWDFTAGKLVIVDEVVAERTTSTEIQHLVAEREEERWGDAKVYRRFLDAPAITRADMVRLQRLDEPASRWQPVNTADPEAAVNALRTACAKRRGDVFTHVLRVHPRCVTIIAHLERGIWNEKRTDFARSAGLGHFDGVAAAMYVVRHVDRNHNPTPALKWDPTREWVSPQYREANGQTEIGRTAQRFGAALSASRRKRA